MYNRAKPERARPKGLTQKQTKQKGENKMTREQMIFILEQNGYDNMDKHNISDSVLKTIVSDIIAKQKEKIRQQQEEQKKQVIKGDRITALGYTFTVDVIIFQDYFGEKEKAGIGSDCFGFDIEFTDPKGNYHHWKQNQDGGTVSRWNGKKFEIFG